MSPFSYVIKHWNGDAMNGFENVYATEENTLKHPNCCDKVVSKCKELTSDPEMRRARENERKRKIKEAVQSSFTEKLESLNWNNVVPYRIEGTMASVHKVKRFLEENKAYDAPVVQAYNNMITRIVPEANRVRREYPETSRLPPFNSNELRNMT
jgi:hypothetical protein